MGFTRLAVAAILLSWRAAVAAAPGPVPVRIIVMASETEARKVLELLNNGADFAVMAREKSVDPTSLDSGFMGVVDPSTLRSELRQALESLPPGQISGLIALPSGFAIVKVLPDSEIADLRDAGKARQFALSAAAGIRFPPDVSGINEAGLALKNFPKPGDWNRNPVQACTTRTAALAAFFQRIQKSLDPASLASSPAKPAGSLDPVQMRLALGQMYAFQGDIEKAVEQWEIVYNRVASDYPPAQVYMEETLGVGYLHLAEQENDVYRKPGERCLFPMAANRTSSK
jgi:hypothetical protein